MIQKQCLVAMQKTIPAASSADATEHSPPIVAWFEESLEQSCCLVGILEIVLVTPCVYNKFLGFDWVKKFRFEGLMAVLLRPGRHMHRCGDLGRGARCS